MLNNNIDKTLIAAISAVLLFEREGSVISISSSRRKGSNWNQDHRRTSFGESNLLHTRNKRSTLR